MSSDNRKQRYRIGVPREYNIAELSPAVREAWLTTLQYFENAGHEIVPVSLPTTELALSAYYILAPAEAASNLAKYDGVRYGARPEGSDGANGVLFSETRGKGFGEEVRRRIILGSYTLSADAIDNYFIQAQKVRRLVQDDFDRVFRHPNALRESDITKPWNAEGVDCLIVPTTPTLPPSLYEVSKQTPLHAYMNDVFTVPASLAGLPAMSIPFPSPATRSGHQHIGIQIIAQFGMDKLLRTVSKLASLFFREKGRSAAPSAAPSATAQPRIPKGKDNGSPDESFDISPMHAGSSAKPADVVLSAPPGTPASKSLNVRKIHMDHSPGRIRRISPERELMPEDAPLTPRKEISPECSTIRMNSSPEDEKIKDLSTKLGPPTVRKLQGSAIPQVDVVKVRKTPVIKEIQVRIRKHEHEIYRESPSPVRQESESVKAMKRPAAIVTRRYRSSSLRIVKVHNTPVIKEIQPRIRKHEAYGENVIAPRRSLRSFLRIIKVRHTPVTKEMQLRVRKKEGYGENALPVQQEGERVKASKRLDAVAARKYRNSSPRLRKQSSIPVLHIRKIVPAPHEELRERRWPMGLKKPAEAMGLPERNKYMHPVRFFKAAPSLEAEAREQLELLKKQELADEVWEPWEK